jgi:hypothetical protein
MCLISSWAKKKNQQQMSFSQIITHFVFLHVAQKENIIRTSDFVSLSVV